MTQLIASMGLRSTRATARHREDPDGVTSNVSEPESLRKTHLSSGPARPIARLNARCLADSIPGNTAIFHSGRCDVRVTGGIHQSFIPGSG
jgi:hypothetical protein